jgi:hypothetical protein
MRRRAANLRLIGMGEAAHRHHRQRRPRRRIAGKDIAIQFEQPAIGCQLGEAIMAGRAFLAGLPGIAGQGRGRQADQQPQYYRD